MGGVSTHWFVEAVKAQDWLERRASEVRIETRSVSDSCHVRVVQ